MYIGTFLLTSSLLLGSVSASERQAMARYHETIERQCVEVLGFQSASSESMNCRLFYEQLFQKTYLTSSPMTFAKADKIYKVIEDMNKTCEGYYEDVEMPKDVLWKCIQQRGALAVNEAEDIREEQYRDDFLRAIEGSRHHHHRW